MAKPKAKQSSVTQPDLLPEGTLPPCLEVVELARRGFDHTASKLMTKQEELCKEVMGLLLRGVSGRAIARQCRISRNSVLAIREVMEARGLVEPLKKQISRQFGNIITMGLEDYQEAIERGDLHPSQLPVPIGIFSQHKALIDGDPTVRVAQDRPPELSVEAVQKYFAGLKSAKTEDQGTAQIPAPLEVQSDVITAKPK